MLNSAEHEISNAHRCKKKYQEILIFSGSDKSTMQFFMLIKGKMPTVVGLLIFMNRKNFMLLSMNFFYKVGA